MRWIYGVLAIGSTMLAQESAPVGIVRGDLSLLLVRAGIGTLDIRAASGTVYQCDFDTQSLIERDNLPIPASSLTKGEQIELLVDRKRERCYARIIRVIGKTALTSAKAPKPRVRLSTNALEHIYPRGNLTFSGVIVRMNPTMLVLRTRTEPEKVIHLREDTRFLDSGHPGELANLSVNTRVFIRGSKTFEDQLEAYQVIWGQIAGPKPRESF
jgi:hypothetical protein